MCCEREDIAQKIPTFVEIFCSMVRIGAVELGDFPLLLAPMEDVSDPPFRTLCKKAGCDMMYTEFISVEGLIRDADKSVQKLDIYDEERPIGIQIFGAELESMMQAAAIVEEARPEVLDINFGCPVKKVVCKLAGAGILQDIPKMVKLTEAVVRSTNLPVTVKTRLGWDEQSIRIVEVAERLQDVGIQAISIHGRTRKQMYKGEADWTEIARVKENPRMHIPVFGNGDIDSPQKAMEYRQRYGVDGIMIGRASIGYPWIFREIKHYFETGELLALPSIHERVDAAREHLRRSIEWKGPKLGVAEMRRHYTNYFRGMPNVKTYRQILVSEDAPAILFATLDEVEQVYADFVFEPDLPVVS
jgi:tRNA-dihydrouridine synthase B